MAFHFAWVDPGQTTFSPAFAREDEQVLSFEIRHDEGDFASLRIEVRNPRVGLLAIGRKRWAWLSLQDGATTTPLFFGRLVGMPEELSDEIVTLTLIAKPLNYQAAKAAVADTMRQTAFWDPVFIAEERRLEPDTVLEARPMVWCIDRVTHAVTTSNITAGEAGTIDFAGDAFSDSVTCSYTAAPQRKVSVEATVSWTQYGFGAVRVNFSSISSYTGDGLLSDWPKSGQSVGGGWKVRDSFARDLYSGLNTVSIVDNDDTYRLYRWSVTGWVEFEYEARRQFSEIASFTISSDMQEMVTEAGDEDTIVIGVSGKADQPIDAGDAIPIVDLRSRAYFKTERGRQSIAYLVNTACTRLLASARCVEVSFEVPFGYASALSLRHSGSLSDSRLPGGVAIGKIRTYSIFADGDGRMGCAVTLACTPGKGGTLTTVPGTPVYVADGYVEGYQVHDGQTTTIVTDGSGSPTVTIADFSGVSIDDDGLDLFNMTATTTVLSSTITYPASAQNAFLSGGIEDINTGLTDHPTRVRVEMRPVNGGPFETPYAIVCSPLMIPKTIDLEAPSA